MYDDMRMLIGGTRTKNCRGGGTTGWGKERKAATLKKHAEARDGRLACEKLMCGKRRQSKYVSGLKQCTARSTHHSARGKSRREYVRVSLDDTSFFER